MMPQTNSTSARPSTIRRLLSAKSTTRRIIYLLLHRVLQIEGVRDHFIARLDAGNDFLLLAGQHGSGDHFHAFEMSVAQWEVDPLTIVQMQNRTGWDCGLGFRLLAVERGGDEHSDAHQAGILHLDTHLGST